MLNGSASPYMYCKDLQTLVTVTLENVITPLREELKYCDQNSEILALEVQDAENKIYECLAQQISVICNADEDIANSILREYPRSETCFKCLGINEDTAQGLLRIRGIGFLQLLDMPDEDITNILQNYGDSVEEIEHVISGLAKIRSNIDLIESDLAFDDDTRNLIKLVIRLNKEHISDLSTALSSSPLDNLTLRGFVQDTNPPQPFRVPIDPPNTPVQISFDEKKCSVTSDPSQKTHRSSPLNQPSPLRSENQPAPASPNFVTPAVSSPIPTCSTSGISAQLTDSTALNGCPIAEVSFARSTNYFWDGDIPLGGVSVPATPVWSERSPCAVTVSPPHNVHINWNGFNSDVPLSSSGDRGSSQNPPSYYMRDREHSRQPGTPPPKHRLKLLFPLHRSKSHESNLSNRVTPPTTCNMSLLPQDLNRQLVGSSTFSPDTLSANGEAFVYQDAIIGSPLITGSRVRHNVPLSPTSHARGCQHEHCSCGASDVQTNTRVLPNSPNSHSYDSVRRISCDYRSPKRPLQPPTLMTTSVDGENLVGVLSIPRSGGTTLVVSSNGLMHKFELDSKFGDFVKGTPCAVCNTRMSFRFQHCLGCKIKVHKSCVPHCHRLPCVNSSGSDGTDLRGSPVALRKSQVNILLTNQTGLRPAHSTPAFQGSESNSASSCTSSAPGSPFGVGSSFPSCHSTTCTGSHPIASPTCTSHPGIANTSHLSSPISVHAYGSSAPSSSTVGQPLSPHCPARCCNQFEFPVATTRDGRMQDMSATTENEENHPLVGTHSSAESERTVVDGVLRRLESMDSQDEYSNLVRANSISVTLREWDIPMDNLVIGDIIGQGTFGTVYRAKWHGEVAVKRIDVDPEDVDGSARLEAFKREVALLHKTRHENLVLFMGACMKPPDLAIVTQLSQGETLYHQLHYRDTVMAVNRTINIACQIAKGMGYLHAKGIVHRDLKTRNIFVEANSRVVIGDFGVFNFVRLCKKAKWGNYLNVPPSWLCYIAPEIIQALNLNYAFVTTASELPLTPSSDVFAFGTVWYELLTNEFPFKGSPAEAIIYLSGRGIKQNLRIPGPKDFKEILTQCWAYSPSRRPEFTTVVRLLDRLPKLHRSPSYPAKPTSCVNSVSHDSLLV
ncbi:Kinase suppressor of Ras 2 [Fasciola gigantica]|uniref:Kinase suppressor of Ras 2 n=1 Tax=Fasciola gigantica TaxID=46835 RepID=A0A504YY59_FASGI|nr:Kinase suppressor of Ras 2 [Fasciola gigantica]